MAMEIAETINANSNPCTSSPELIYTLKSHTKSLTAVCFSPNGQMLATASADSTISLFSFNTGSLLHKFTSHTGGINSICFSSDSAYLASCSDDKSIHIHSVITLQLVRNFSEHTSYVVCLAYNPSSTLLVSGSFDETVRLWNLCRNRCHRTISAHSEAVTGVDFNKDGTMIVSSSYDGSIRLWDTCTGACLKTLVHKDQSAVGGVSFTPSSEQLLCSALDGSVRLWDVYNSKIVKTYVGHLNSKIPMTARLVTKPATRTSLNLPISKSSRSTVENGGSGGEKDKWGAVMIGSEDGKVVMWDVQTRQILKTWQAHSGAIIATATHPNFNIVVTATIEPENSVKIWLFHPPSSCS
ncbi:related to wd-repeat protein 5 [Melanopsichium pennsylvanicum]|uniref:Related to wd-repeat protein 5 n=1 Tax=Melanopsichium pennsylvanicum TaxID=63383 RepID=A0AAJ5C873_9BASI|nr:related to wd-repeat protein 5 [Melanopsichium pennsylvanicum]